MSNLYPDVNDNQPIYKLQFLAKDYEILNDFSMKNVIQVCLEQNQITTA